jgi:hypothetical protein
VYGAEEMPSAPDPFGANDLPVAADNQRMNPDGERALRLALSAIDRQTPVDHKKRGETLVELGDWYLSAGALGKGMDTYREAWKELTQADATELLSAAPRVLAYRPPPSSTERSRLNPDDAEERYCDVKYTVTRDGRTDNVQLAGSDAAESTQKSVISAVKKMRYAPRFENGEPVDTQGVVWHEKLLIRTKQQQQSANR